MLERLESLEHFPSTKSECSSLNIKISGETSSYEKVFIRNVCSQAVQSKAEVSSEFPKALSPCLGFGQYPGLLLALL